MNHYIISFHVVIDGKDMGIGSVSEAQHHRPNLLKGAIIKYYRKNYPGSAVVAVKIMSEKEVTASEYNAEAKNFIKIK